MANNDLNQIRIFCTVAQLCSFTKAAELLGIEKSTVSAKVSQLESRLGVRLLQRTTRSVSLTEAGEQYLGFCKQALDALQMGDDYIAQLSHEPTGRLRVSVPQNFIDETMADLILPFLQQYPKVDLELVQTNRHVDLLAEQFDVAVRVRVDDIEDSTFIYRKIFHSEWSLVANTQHIQQYGVPTSVQSLLEQPSIGMSRENINSQAHMSFQYMGQKVQLKHRLAVNSMRAVKQAIMSGLGIGLLPTGMVQEELSNNQLVSIEENIDIQPASLYLVYPSRSGQPAKLKAFVDALAKNFDR